MLKRQAGWQEPLNRESSVLQSCGNDFSCEMSSDQRERAASCRAAARSWLRPGRMVIVAVVFYLSAGWAWGLDYPGTPPGRTVVSEGDPSPVLGNDILRARWTVDSGRITALTFTNKQTGRTLQLDAGHLPQIVLADGRTISLSALSPTTAAHLENNGIIAGYRDSATNLDIQWSAVLDDGANAISQTLELSAEKDTKIKELVFVDARIDRANQVGRVDGSVVVSGDIFLAVEHPLAKNTVSKNNGVRCILPRGNVLKAGQTWRYSSVIGVVPPGQLRRGFLYYLEHRRAHGYRPFLHYNSWYHLNIGRPDNHMTEAECLATINDIGHQLVRQRGVTLDAFVWDDGWDDFNTLWGFHKDFPNGFKKLKQAGAKFGAAQGVWMSPWGGYGKPKKKRLAYGASEGYETNRNGFSMAGPKYRAAFRNVCLKMMRQNGVVFFKFDGMGAGGGTGAASELADDVDAVLTLTTELRKENPDLFISATVGTWASPFWTLYADSIWRQGGDTGFHGPGSTRQQWITYRDMFCYRCVVKWGPLYPLNSLMLHGPCIGERANPAKMTRDEQSVCDEIWTFFGSGTDLQELYISPHLLTSGMWDVLAAAAKWSRSNSDILVDTHWIGGNPEIGDVYGWASWQPRGGIVVLRNPSDKASAYQLELAQDLELLDSDLTDYLLKSARSGQRISSLRAKAIEPLRIELQPFEVLVFEATAVDGAPTYDAKAYRRRCAEHAAAQAKAFRAIFQPGSVWEYTYKGHTYQRHFRSDGTAQLFVDGKRTNTWNGFTWHIADRCLVIDKPDGGTEQHELDNEGRLILPAGLGTARKVAGNSIPQAK